MDDIKNSQTNLVSLQDDSDLVRILNLFTRHYNVYIICVLASMAIAYLITRYSKPIYRVTSSLMILEDRPNQSVGSDEFINSEMFGLNRSFQNELYILKSTPVIEQTVKNLDLTINYLYKDGFQYYDAYNSLPIQILTPPDHVQPVGARFMLSIKDDDSYSIKASGKNVNFINLYTGEGRYENREWSYEYSGRFGELIETPEFAFVVRLDSTTSSYISNEFIYGFEFVSIGSATGQLSRQLEFSVLDREATIINIGVRTTSPTKGKDILTELMDVYATQNVNRKNHNASVTIAYIEEQLGEISDSLNLTEDNLQRFMSSRQLTNVNEQATGLSGQYRELQNQLAELTTQKRYYDYLADYVTGDENSGDISIPAAIGIDNEMLNELVSNLISLQTQRNTLIQNNQERNPLVQRLEIQINSAKNAILDNIGAVQKTTDISLDELNKRMNRVSSEISRLPQTQRQLTSIERDYQLNDAIYNYLLEKRAEAKISQASNLPDNIIVEPASISGMVFPDPRKNYVFAFALGIMLPFGFLFFKSLINEKIEHQARIDRLTDAPLLGKIPHFRKKTTNTLITDPRSTLAEAYRTLRTNIEFRFKSIRNKTMLVSSSIAGEGKSFNAINLAISYSQLGRKTLIADCDLRKQTQYFNEKEISNVGMSSFLNGKSEVAEIILPTPYPKLDYIPSGPVPANPVELLASDNVKEIFDYLKTQYDCIIIDSAPLAQVTDSYLLMETANIRVIIGRYNFTPKKVFNMIMNDLNEKNIENVCLVMNDNRILNDQYGYGYGYEKKKRGWFRL